MIVSRFIYGSVCFSSFFGRFFSFALFYFVWDRKCVCVCVCGFLLFLFACLRFVVRKCRWSSWNLRLGISVVKQLSAECAFKIAFCTVSAFFSLLLLVVLLFLLLLSIPSAAKDWDKFRTIQRNVKIVFVSTFPKQILFFSLDEWKIPSEIFFNIK